jgi:acetyl-CoA acyltransferase 1
MAMFLAGFPETTCVVAINRFCSSGIESCAMIAAKIKSGKKYQKMSK